MGRQYCYPVNVCFLFDIGDVIIAKQRVSNFRVEAQHDYVYVTTIIVE